jgi:hypothetical protein
MPVEHVPKAAAGAKKQAVDGTEKAGGGAAAGPGADAGQVLPFKGG